MKLPLTFAMLLVAAACSSPEPEVEAPEPTLAELQGITDERANEIWTAATSTELVARHQCSPMAPASCEFQMTPAGWAVMDINLKRGFVTGVGQAAAVLHGAEVTTFVDGMSGAMLASYVAQQQYADIKN